MKRQLIIMMLLLIGMSIGLKAQGYKHNLTPDGGFETFDQIAIEGVYTVELEQGSQAALFVTSHDTTTPGLKYDVVKGVLKIKAGTRTPVDKIYIIHTGLQKIKLSSAVELSTANVQSGDFLVLDLGGACEVTMILDVNLLDVQVSGAAELDLSGRADTVRAEILGAAEYNALELATISTRIDVAGAADAKVNARDELVGNVSGIGNISYENEPLNVDINKSGFSNISIEEGQGDTLTLKLGGQEITIVDEDKKTKKQTKFNGHWGGVELHLNTYVNPDYEITMPSGYEFLDPELGRSIGFSINLFENNFNIIRNRLGLTTGLGFTYNNYRLDPSVILVDNEETIAAVIDTISVREKSKLRVNHLTVPLILEYQTNSKGKMNSFHVGAGMIFSYKLGARTKNIFEEAGESTKVKARGDYHLNPIRLEATARVGLGKINLFANYDILPMFKEGEGPELYPVTMGISLVGW